MNIDDLRTILLVYHQGSFAAAARHLDVDPSSISRMVASVEERLGFRVFQRTTRRQTVTEAGQVYLHRIEPLLDELSAAGEQSRTLNDSPSGLLRMTASVAFAHECIMPLLSEFRAAYPDIEIDFQITDANVDLTADAIDLAFRLTSTPSGDYVCRRIRSTRYQVCASPGYLAEHSKPKSPEGLTHLDCLRFSLPGYRDQWRFRNAKGKVIAVPINGSIVLSNALAMRQATLIGIGPALLADWMVGDALESGDLIDLFPNYQVTATEFDTGVWLLYPSRRYLPQKVRLAIDFFSVAIGLR